ncbi:11204_t:CDS:2, partial [Scutellospora calospora]
NGFSNAKYKKFDYKDQAEQYIKEEKEIINIDSNTLQVWTDGSTFDNRRVFWKKNDPKNLSKWLPGKEQTNNRAEIFAIIRALEICEDKRKKLEIMTDSKYVINAYEKWINKWEKNRWITSCNTVVKNKDLFVRLKRLIENRIGTVKLVHVHGHQGNYGNEQVDKLAKQGSLKEYVKEIEKKTERKITDYFK